MKSNAKKAETLPTVSAIKKLIRTESIFDFTAPEQSEIIVKAVNHLSLTADFADFAEVIRETLNMAVSSEMFTQYEPADRLDILFKFQELERFFRALEPIDEALRIENEKIKAA